MNTTIYEWASDWGYSVLAVHDLLQRLGMGAITPQDGGHGGESEAAVSNEVRIDAARQGTILWRNNVGAYMDDRGNMIRYGLCNDTKKLNQSIKSADLIGIRPVLIGPEHCGQTIGQFVSYEVKERGWVFTGTAHELAQRKWLEIILSKGGEAAFKTGTEPK